MIKTNLMAIIMVVSFLLPATTSADYVDTQTLILEELQGLIDAVAEIDQQAGIINCLDAKITTIQKAVSDIKDKNDTSALNSIKSFVSIVEIQRGNQLTEEQADNLITAAGLIPYYIRCLVDGICPICGGSPCIPPCPYS